jgi:hypothetical protein
MPDQLERSSAVVRLFALCSALLITAQAASLPAAAAPAHDDELTIIATDHEDQAAGESAEAADEEGLEPAEAEGVTPADSEAQPAEAADSPAEDAGQPVAELTDDGSEPAAELADDGSESAAADDEGEPVAESTDDAADAEPVAEPADGGDEEAVHVEAASAPTPVHTETVIAAPAPVVDEVDDLFLRRLLDAINERRDRNGTRRLAFVPASANSALDDFLAETVTRIGWPGHCSHDLVDGAFAWDYVMAAGFGGDPRGEVLACPSPEPYWTPDRTAEQWWDSPIHFDVLYADEDATSIACSAYGVRGGANEGGKKKRKGGGTPDAASAVICVTFRG